MDKNKKTLSRSRAWLYIALATIVPPILFWITLYHSLSNWYGPATASEILLAIVTLASPVLVPYLAYRYFKQKDGLARYNLGKISQKERAALQEARTRSRNKQLVVIGIAFVVTLIGIFAPPLVRDLSIQWQYGAQDRFYREARERGCHDLRSYMVEESSDISRGHYTVIKKLAFSDEATNLRDFSLRLDRSFSECAHGVISPAQQDALEAEYLTYLEKTAHRVLADNPTGLSEAEIANIRELEARNHR